MVPVREVVVFPHSMTPFVLGRPSSVRALQSAIAGDKRIFMAAQRDASVSEPAPDEIFGVGTIVNIVQSLQLPDGNIKLLVEGVERAKVVSVSDEDGFFLATVETSSYQVEAGPRLDALVSRVTGLLRQYTPPGQHPPLQVPRMDEPGKLSDTVAAYLPLALEEKQALLEIFDPLDRLARVTEILHELLSISDVRISRAVLTRWAETCLMMNHLGTLARKELADQNGSERARDLAERARKLARHLFDELVACGAKMPESDPKTGQKG